MKKFKILFLVSLTPLIGGIVFLLLSFVLPAAAAPFCDVGANCCLQEVPDLGISCTPEYYCGPSGCQNNDYVISQSSSCAGQLKYNCAADACQCEEGAQCGAQCCTGGTICCGESCEAPLSGPAPAKPCAAHYFRSLASQCDGSCGGCLDGYENLGGAPDEHGYTICVPMLPKVTLTPYETLPDENASGRDSLHVNTPDGDFIINGSGQMMIGDNAMTLNAPNNLVYGVVNAGTGNFILLQMPSGVDRFKVDLGGAVTASGDITAQSNLYVYGTADIDGSILTDSNLSVAGDIYIGANKAIIMNAGADTTLYIGNYIGAYSANIDVDGYGYFTKGVLTRAGSSSAFSGNVSVTGAASSLSVTQGSFNAPKGCFGAGACAAAANQLIIQGPGELCINGDCRSAWPAGAGAGDITDVLSGVGIIVNNPGGPQPTISADYTQAQQRVSSGCAAGSSIRLINQDGTVVCEPDDDTGGIAGITAGTNIETISLGEDVTINVVDSPTFADTVTMNDNLNVSGSIAGASLGVSGAISAATLETTGSIAINGQTINSTHGIRAQGSSAGAYFSDSNSSGYAYLGYGDYGISAAGSLRAGYFSETDTGTTVALGYGGNAIVTHGTTSGGQFINDTSENYAYLGSSSYGIAAYGSTAGGRFEDRDSGKYAYIGYGNYGGYFIGQGYFSDKLRVAADLQVDGTCSGSATCDQDIAEYISASADVEPGDVVEISEDGAVRKSSQPRSDRVIGVISTNPAIIFPGAAVGDSKQPLALSGVVPVKVSAENGAITAGDLLTSSSVPGHAMRCEDKSGCSGAIIGKALESFDGEIGVIKMIVTLQ
ncbi:hypothetical protein KJ969_04805 [Patescibacteria group bacterium]|nr:hypothetical protein [Patescibacteria group bacterium]MBU1921806.1 hypothetical protein [Patescibacteria group bacterium]